MLSWHKRAFELRETRRHRLRSSSLGPCSTTASNYPGGVEVATYGGDAWLGVVAFVTEDIRPRGDRGIYFYNLDATDLIGVSIARRLFQLPYYRASMTIDRTSDRVEFASHRIHRGVSSVHFDATYRPTGDGFDPESGSLVEFLVENYYFLTAGRTRLFRGGVEHDPWPMYEGELLNRQSGTGKRCSFTLFGSHLQLPFVHRT